MYKVIIADDKTNEIDHIEQLLDTHLSYQIIGKITVPSNLINDLTRLKPDLLFLGLLNEAQKNLALTHEITSLNLPIQIIFVTNSELYAIDAFEYGVCDYLIKPVSKSRLSRALKHFEKYHRNLNVSNKNYNQPLKFNTQKGFVLINPEEIVCLEADQVYTKIRTTNNKLYYISQNIGKLEPLLNMDQFIRISRSSIANVSFISEIVRKNRICILRWNNYTHNILISKSGIDKLECIFS